MIQLLMTVCAAASPYHCKEEAMVFAEPGLTAYMCVLKGQLEIAKWSEQHPGWTVRRYSCTRAGQFATI